MPGGKIEHTRSFGPGAGGPPIERTAFGGCVAVETPQARKKYASRSRSGPGYGSKCTPIISLGSRRPGCFVNSS